MSTIIKFREFKAMLKTHGRSRGGRAVYFKVLDKLGTALYGNVGKVICLHELNTHKLIGKTDPIIMFDEVRTLHIKYNCLATDGVTAEVTMHVAHQVVRKSPLYKAFIESNHELDTMKFDDYGSKTLKLHYKNVSQVPDNSPHVFAAVDITYALDKAFVYATSHYAFVFTRGLWCITGCKSVLHLPLSYVKTLPMPKVNGSQIESRLARQAEHRFTS